MDKGNVMPAANYDIVLQKGEAFNRIITWKDYFDEDVDLTGYTGELDIKLSKESDAVLVSAVVVVGATTITIDISEAVIEDLDFEVGVYDLKLSSTTRNIRLLEGSVKVLEEV
jgi:hypothetical protein